MKKIVKSLPFKLLLGVIIGIAVGQLSGMEMFKAAGDAVMNVVVTVKFILSELINFCVPLIIIGFIAPSITRLGRSASRMLAVALFCAYTSSILAALLSMAAGYTIIPHLSIVSEVDGLKELPEIVFQLEIPERDERPCVIGAFRSCGDVDKSGDNDKPSGRIPEDCASGCNQSGNPGASGVYRFYFLRSFL